MVLCQVMKNIYENKALLCVSAIYHRGIHYFIERFDYVLVSSVINAVMSWMSERMIVSTRPGILRHKAYFQLT